jgi:CHAT domain-containing protein/Flp pilus assembly protein TadD
MKHANHYIEDSHRIFPPNLGVSVIGCLIALSVLTYGCRDALAVIVSQRAAAYASAVASQDGGKYPGTALYDEEQSQGRQDQAKDKQKASEAQIANPFEVLKLSTEFYQLSAPPSRKNAAKAIEKSSALLAIFKNQNIKMGMAATFFGRGSAYYFLGRAREALNDYLEAWEYSKEPGFGMLRPFLEAGTGAAYASLGETDKALESLNRALPLVRRLNLVPLLAMTLRGLGEANVYVGQKRKALEYLNEALRLYQQEGDWPNEVQVLSLISALRSSLGQSTEAMKSARAAVDRCEEKNARDWQAYAYFAVGAAYTAVGSLEEAVTAYNRSLELLQGQQDSGGEATALNNLGLIYAARGDFARALDYFERALKLSKTNGEPRLAAYALNNLGTIYSRRGDTLTALRHFKEALDFAVPNKDKRLEAAVLSSLADAYFLANISNHSLRLLKEAAATFAAIEEPGYESGALISLADAYGAMGRYQEALDLLRPVLESRRLAGDPGREGYVLREMGYMYTHLGDRSNALKHYAAALAKLEAAGDASGQVDLYVAMGSASVTDGKYKKAEELYSKGLALARTAELRQSEMLLLAGLGFAHEKQGNLAQAESLYDQGIAVGESLRASARIEELKTGVGSIAASLLVPAVRLKFKLGKWVEAFEYAEKARARTFLDQMNNARIDVRKGSDPELIEQEQSLRFDIRSLEEKLRKQQRDNPSSEAARVMAASLKEKEEAYAALLIRLKVSHPDYAELQSYSPRPLNEIQPMLGGRTTLISYFVTSEATFAFVVGSDSIQAVKISVKEAELRAAIDWFRGFASLRDPQPQSLKQLHGWLVAPIRQYIKTAEVVIVPHSVLHYVPFAALTDGRACFGDEHAICYLPSASILPSIRRRVRSDGRRVLAASQSQADGLPALRFADEEARSVANLYYTQPLLTGRATRAAILKRAPACEVLHIAAHAELNAHSPLFSRILLSPDKDESGAIEVREVYGMDLARTNLVVLSACQTQLGAHSKGDDIVGLNRAFIYAGASSVIASLWTVDDQATSFLMRAFYGNLKQGMSKASALQAAQAATRKKYPHPYYWAGFVLTGDPGRTSHRR